MRAHPEVVAALAARGHHRPVAGDDRGLDVRSRTDARAVAGPPAGLVRHLVPGDADGQPLRAPGVRPQVRRRPEHHGAARARERPRPRSAGGATRSTCPDPGRATCGPTSSRWRSPSPRAPPSPSTGTELRWQNWSMRLGFNYREGPVIYQVAYDDHGTVRDIALPAVARRDGGALPRHVLRPLPADRLRHRRVGSGLHDHLAGARLRLPRRDPLRRRRAARHPGRAVHDHERHLPARGGRRASCGSTSTTSTAPRCAGCAGWWCPATPPWPTTSTSLYWRFYQDGNIECEVRATGIMVTTPFGDDGRPPPPARWSTSGPTRRSTSTSSSPGWTSTSTGRPEHRDGGRRRRTAGLGGEPLRLGLVTVATPVRSEAEAARDFTWEHPAVWKVVNPNRTNAHGTTPPTSWCRRRRSRR